MSTEATPDRLQWLILDRDARFPRRIEPPDRLTGPPRVNYPDRDGRPRSDNSLQEQWISRIRGGLGALYRDDPNVFVASNLMWYPVKGNNRRRLAPDVMVIFGRPKKYRGSYIQHREKGIAPQVAVEILSPGNRKRAMDYKRTIYEKYGVEEYYVFDPYQIKLEVWLKDGDAFRLEPEPNEFVSPRMGLRFELGEDLTIYAPDGRPFLDYAEVAHQRDESERRSRLAEREARTERQRAGEAEQRAGEAESRAQAERQRAETERQRAERLAARLRELGLEPEED
jgi:Uma2 family endonuclease